jgi:8-oxo-dGTP pyrophosphatase MutT (NUDIX family)
MKNPLRVPRLLGEPLYIPFVGAIIERENKGKKQIVVQTRKKKTDNKYSDTLEIPGGKLRAFEDVYETLRREVKEECGLTITLVKGENERISHKNRDDSSDLIKPFCVTQMKNGPFVGLIFICEAAGTLVAQKNETREPSWINVDDLRKTVEKSPEKIYTAFLTPLKEYLSRS